MIVAKNAAAYTILRTELTAQRVRAALGELVKGSVERYELDNLGVLNFVLQGALDGGATRSLRLDTLGKSLADRVLNMNYST